MTIKTILTATLTFSVVVMSSVICDSAFAGKHSSGSSRSSSHSRSSGGSHMGSSRSSFGSSHSNRRGTSNNHNSNSNFNRNSTHSSSSNRHLQNKTNPSHNLQSTRSNHTTLQSNHGIKSLNHNSGSSSWFGQSSNGHSSNGQSSNHSSLNHNNQSHSNPHGSSQHSSAQHGSSQHGSSQHGGKHGSSYLHLLQHAGRQKLGHNNQHAPIVNYPVIQPRVPCPLYIPHQEPVAVQPVPVIIEELPQVPAGATFEFLGNDIGPEIGQVVLHFNGITLPTTLHKWEANTVIMTLPGVGVTEPVRAELILVRANGEVDNSIEILLTAAIAE